MTTRSRATLLAVAATFAAAWAGWLVEVHRDAVRETLQPGVLCGPDGGCGDVLASEWSTIGGVAVSAPAVPLFGAIAALALLVAAGRADARRIAALAVGSAGGGLLFGAWLLYHMLFSIGAVCRYCLVMDGATALVLVAGLALHPDGPLAAVRGIGQAARDALRPGPELLTVAALVLGTPIVALLLPEPVEEEVAVVAVREGDQEPALAAGAAASNGDTRRVVIPAVKADIPIDDTTPVLGPADAPVTIAVFEDFQCPFCRKLTGNLEAFRLERPDQVRIAWFDFPMHSACNNRPDMRDMHPEACGAAIAGECARQQGRFWEMHDRLFQTGRLADADLVQHASALELDLEAFAACRADPATLDAVRADTDIGRRYNITGTPTFFVNGRRFSGAQPVEALRAIADAVADDPADRVLLDVALEGEIIGDVGPQPEEVQLDGPRGPFYIDTFEASVVDGAARSVPGVAPARGVTWAEADAACRAAGKRLCTEDEWLTACTGVVPVDRDGDGMFSDDPLEGRLHPYGPYPQDTWCASARDRDDPRPLITGDHPRCVTPDGVYDLEGSVKEWVGLAPYEAALQGGSYFSKRTARCAYHKANEAPDARDPASGFRCCRGPEPERVERHDGGKVGDAVQRWSAPLLDGGAIGSEALAGRPHLLVFWASHCGPCRKELPLLAELYERYRGAGLEIVGVTVDTDITRARRYLAEQPLPFPIALDPESALMGRFDAPSTPTTFYVTADGQIRQRDLGFDDKAGIGVLEANIRALLAAR